MSDPPAPAPAATPAGDPERASGGLRALGVLLALVLAFGAAVMILVAVDLGDSATCDDFPTLSIEEQLEQDGECFDGSSAQKSASVILAGASGIVGALAALIALAFAITGTRGGLLVRVVGGAILLGALSVAIGSL